MHYNEFFANIFGGSWKAKFNYSPNVCLLALDMEFHENYIVLPFFKKCLKSYFLAHCRLMF